MGQVASAPSCGLEPSDCRSIKNGTFQTDPDLAGRGIVLSLAIMALIVMILSFFCLWLQGRAFFDWLSSTPEKRSARFDEYVRGRSNLGVRGCKRKIAEDILVALSDQQLVTVVAYITVVYFFLKCSISAYHYNIVVNIVILCVATHLSAICVISHYFQNWLIALFRGGCILLMMIFTFLLLARRSWSDDGVRFPTAVPDFKIPDELDSKTLQLFFPAACYQTAKNITEIVPEEVETDWTATFDIAVCVIFSILYLAHMFFLWQDHSDATEGAVLESIWYKIKWWIRLVTVIIAAVVCGISFAYVQCMRGFITGSGWFEPEEDGSNPENDLTSFGQLLPGFLAAFAVATTLTEAISSRLIKDEEKTWSGL
ncbi:hypothetical protein ABW19_dt0207550 [Dactylella cylindrospora]|nr:hypothetical protein ABW19_dt0207550 [Dactylella cylindrospora]